jgi:hypothetical protein
LQLWIKIEEASYLSKVILKLEQKKSAYVRKVHNADSI